MTFEDITIAVDALAADEALLVLPPGSRLTFDQERLAVREAFTDPDGRSCLRIEASAIARLAPNPRLG